MIQIYSFIFLTLCGCTKRQPEIQNRFRRMEVMIRWILESSPGQSTAASPCRWSPSCAAGVWPRLQPGRRWNWSWPAGRTWSTGTALLGRTSGTELRSRSGRRQRKKTRIRIGINETASAPSPPDLLRLCPPAFISPLIYKYWTERQPWTLRRLEVAMNEIL